MKGAQRNFLERAALVVSDDRERVRHAIAFQFADPVALAHRLHHPRQSCPAAAARHVRAVDVFSPSASMTALWRRGRGERPGSIWSSIALALPWVAAQRRVLPADLCCP